MTTPLLSTKLYIPPLRSELVSRPRLVDRLNEGLVAGRALTLISAPAGFGKTTLLREWIAGSASQMRAGWVSLDEHDNDLAQFLGYVIAALQEVDAGIGQACQVALQAPQPPPVEELIASLINDIAVTGTPLVLVLDDYHTISLAAIHKALGFLLSHMPSQLHLVIASRADPPLSLSRLRARRQMTELRAIDLRFSGQETATFLNQVAKLGLSPAQVAVLANRTEGWIAGLQLAALSMESLSEARRRDFIVSLSGDDRYILDYLVEEVLDRQPAQIRTFLLQTSILDRLYGPLCDAVVERGAEGASPVSGQEILEYLEHHNLFLVPLDNRRQWYRYHHLFAELLHNQLVASRPDRTSTLHRRASEWYEQNDLLSEAIAHSLAGQDFERAAQLTERTFSDRMRRGEDFATMLARLQALPDEILRARPGLNVMYAWMLSISFQPDAAEQRLLEIERDAGDQLPSDFSLQVAQIRAEVARYRNDLDKAIALSQQVLAALPGDLSATNMQTLTAAVFNLALAYLAAGDLPHAQHWLLEARKISRAAESITLMLVAEACLAELQALEGQLDSAEETCRQALQLAQEYARQSGRVVPAAAYVHCRLGELLWQQNKLPEAERQLAQSIDLGERWQIAGDMLRDAYVCQGAVRWAQGNLSAALKSLQQAERLAQAYRSVPGYGEPIAAMRAQLLVARARASGNAEHLEAVEQWARARGLRIDGPVRSLDQEHSYLVWARLLIARDQVDQAQRLLARLLEEAEQYDRTGRAVEIRVLQALAERARGDRERALHILEQALLLAEPQGYVRTFVDEGTPMAELLRALAARRSAAGRSPIGAGYVAKLLEALGSSEATGGAKPERSRSLTLASEALTEREMEVLRLLRTELSGPEIAQELYLSVNTVKTHTKRIYGKLGAHSRYEAVERAQELGLM
jgi:LuxR family maltose regulon positive regulatory protein